MDGGAGRRVGDLGLSPSPRASAARGVGEMNGNRVSQEQILESGLGATPCYLARTYGARVVGADIHEAMVTQACERARR